MGAAMEQIVVLMSTYNGERYLKEAVDSVLQQTGCQVSLLVRDDGSSDDTVSILERYREQGMLDYYNGNNVGPAYSFIDLLYHAPAADYYAFADQDDIWDPDKLATAIDAIREYPTPAVYHSNARLIAANGEEVHRLLHEKEYDLNYLTLLCSGGLLGCTVVFNRSMLETIIAKEPPAAVRMHDYYLGAVCMSVGGTVVYDPTPHLGYRQHDSNAIGVAYSAREKVLQKWKKFKNKGTYSIGEQAAQILRDYSDDMPLERRKECSAVADYDKHIWNTVRIALSLRTHYSSWKNSLFIRFAILFHRR